MRLKLERALGKALLASIVTAVRISAEVRAGWQLAYDQR
jgi:hypothetical protein